MHVRQSLHINRTCSYVSTQGKERYKERAREEESKNGADHEQEGNDDEVSFVGFPFGLHFNRG